MHEKDRIGRMWKNTCRQQRQNEGVADCESDNDKNDEPIALRALRDESGKY